MGKGKLRIGVAVGLLSAAILAFAVTMEPPTVEAALCSSQRGVALGWGEGNTCPAARRDCQSNAEAAGMTACFANGPDSTYIFNSITFGPCVDGQTERKGRDCRVKYTCEFCPVQ
jgi:hypothetical protein